MLLEKDPFKFFLEISLVDRFRKFFFKILLIFLENFFKPFEVLF